MQGLMEFIFGNFFLVFIIIAAIFSFISNISSTKEKQKGTTEKKQDGSTLRDAMKRMQEMIETFDEPPQIPKKQSESTVETASNDRENMEQASTSSLEESTLNSYEEQYSRLQEQYETASEVYQNDVTDQSASVNSRLRNNVRSDEQEGHLDETNIDFQSRLNREGLIESVVMAEVLGPPRSRRRYSHRILDR